MNKSILLVICGLTFVAQWFIPGAMMYQKEETLSKGTAYKFKTRPIDPYDPFRGKYVTLNYDMEQYFQAKDTTISGQGVPVYVYIDEGVDGYAVATHVSETPLDIPQDFIEAQLKHAHKGQGRIDLPFDRFYMEESKAYEAEKAVREASWRRSDSLAPVCYAQVYVKDGEAVINDLFIDDRSIIEIAAERKEASK